MATGPNGADLYTALLVAAGQGIEQAVAQVYLLMVALSLGGVIILAALLVAANALTCRLYAEGYGERAGHRLWELLCDDDWQGWIG